MKYIYRDENGEPLFQVSRRAKPDGGKTFSQHRWTGDGWAPGLNGQPPVPYRLPELLAGVAVDETIYIVEGEKDADALADLGHTATTNPGGAGKWRTEFSEYLRDADVVIVFDRDEPGRQHALDVAAKLDGVARHVRFARAREGKDVSDHFAAGYGLEDLVFRRPPGTKKTKRRETGSAGRIVEGGRNATLTKFAGRLRRAGMDEADMALLLQAVNAARCDPPLPDREVKTIAHSVSRYDPAPGCGAARKRGRHPEAAVTASCSCLEGALTPGVAAWVDNGCCVE